MLAIFALLVGIASVIDGDTLEIHGERIRLDGIDAPESRQVCTRNGQPWMCGKDAALALSGLIGSNTVHCPVHGRDRYKRALSRCVVNGVEINSWLVENGWALDYVKYSEGLYFSQQEDAKKQRRGIWASEFEEPWDWRRSRR